MEDQAKVHATCVAHDRSAVLITGASGSGKSALGLALMAMGCTLVADDRVLLSRKGDAVVASCPPAIIGAIEARGVGLLRAATVTDVPVVLVVDLDGTSTERMPHRHNVTLLGREIPLIIGIQAAHFAPAVLQYLKAGWSDL